MHPPHHLRSHYTHFPDPTLYSPTHKTYIQIRRVGRQNFTAEMNNISYLIQNSPFNVVSMDTEYPGVIYGSSDMQYRNPLAQYWLMKANIDLLGLIQVGFTLSDSAGNLATLGPQRTIVAWEFAISDFDERIHPHNLESISMLKSRGLNFEFHRVEGILSYDFAQAMLDIGLVGGANEVHWVTFHGAYDFGYLIKALTRSTLPDSLQDFLNLVRLYFGEHVYDVKHMIKPFPYLFGGLEAIAARIRVCRVLSAGHQAGSDSLLTQMVHAKIKATYFQDAELYKKVAGKIHPLAN
uniref:poly(A)-specific ribonuclease n=1 Tax=Kalanchoe fedtschenkoi TaxID=63787 RepID=A0A7N0ZQB0_KALFE